MAVLTRRRNHRMVVDYADDLRLFGTPWKRVGLVVLVGLYLFVPVLFADLTFSWLPDIAQTAVQAFFNLNTLAYVGVFAIGAIGLNLLTGYTGQISLGHAVFLGVGAYTAAYVGNTYSWPMILWLPAATLAGFLVGAAIGPFALRLRGLYLVVVTLGLVFVGDHIFRNWESVTAGNTGVSTTAAEPVLGPLDFTGLELFGHEFTTEQSMFWLIWFFVALTALLVKNIVRTRPGRALQAIRERDLAAEIIGVDLSRYKIMAFAISSGIASLAGALYGALQLFVSPVDFALLVSIQFIAIIIIGGLGTVYGSIIGALLIGGLPRIIDELSRSQDLPGVGGDVGGVDGLISVSSLNQIIFGLAIAAVLLIESRGVAALWERSKLYFRTWPFTQ
ncbi:MAG: branched-chain amino acid ABC transporter permease [Acidimicrobiales bacterium]|nr:branched-chain amino acid ABC transporter permease [Acidimicrobiales bacterium]